MKYGKVKDGKMKIIKNIHLESVGEMTLIASDDLDLLKYDDSYCFLLEIFVDSQFFSEEVFQSENFVPLGKILLLYISNFIPINLFNSPHKIDKR